MHFSALMRGIQTEQNFPPELEIGGIVLDSRNAGPGKLFVATKGQRVDGHDHVAQALAKGSPLALVERDLGIPNTLVVGNTRQAYAMMWANFYGNPAGKLRLIGVTGTNGKTTVTNIIWQLLLQAGKKAGLIGTNENRIGQVVIPAKYTTPDAASLQVLLARMVAAGCQYVVMEVSSHALDQHRLAGCHFDYGVFTNLTQDHLDYHHTMAAYFEAKAKLFALSATSLINVDDDSGQKLATTLAGNGQQVATLSRKAGDYLATDVVELPQGVTFTLVHGGEKVAMAFGMPGEFSVDNALAALACVHQIGVPLHQLAGFLAACKGVTGRAEVIPTNLPFTVIRDYAHASDGLEKILTTLRRFAPGKILVLFGSAGERDKTKRPQMGKIVGQYADYCMVTSDNPRGENEEEIMEGVAIGLRQTGTPFAMIADRREAILQILQRAKPGDIVLLAGKGHEEYQALSYATIAFDERQIVQEWAKEEGFFA